MALDAQHELREIKNKIIGNPHAKDSVANHASLTRVLQCLEPTYASSTRIEAANVLYSVSSGSQEAIASLLRHRAHAALLAAITSLEPSSPHRLKVALGRALRTLIGTLADHSGPPLWGILPSTSLQLRKETQFALEELFQPTSLDSWLPLLQDSAFYPFLCIAISTGVRTPAHRTVLCEWIPSADRAKASKGKRGWEKPATPLSPSGASFSSATTASQGWVIRQLLGSSLEQTAASQAVAPSLEALAALCQDNPTGCALLRADLPSVTSSTSIESSPTGSLQSFLLQLRSPSPEVRIATTQLLANVIKTFLAPPPGSSTTAGMPPGFHRLGAVSHRDELAHESALSTCLTVIHILLGMVRSEDESLLLRAKACFILSKLVSDDRTITEAAVDCGSLQALFIAMERTLKQSSTTVQDPEVPSMEVEIGEEEEEESLEELHLREAAFTCIATICLSDSQYSRQILEMDAARGQSSVAITSSRPHSTTTSTQQPFLFSLLSKSITHTNLGVRYSALQLVRALTRALAVLRTGLVDTDVPMKIIEVISGGLGEIDREGNVAKEKVTGETEMSEQTEHRAVIIAALMALCNLVNDYAPFRETIIQGGAIRHLVRRTYSLDDGIRLNALWAIKNALFNAKSHEMVSIMEVLTWDHFAVLAEDADRRIREQAIVLLQNVTTTSQNIAFVIDGLGSERLVKILQKAMSNNDPKAVEHAIRALSNISTGYESHRDLVLQEPFLILLRKSLTHSLVSVRCAAAECICELLARKPIRHRELREAGIEQALRAVIGGRERGISGLQHTLPVNPYNSVQEHSLSSASAFGAALGSAGPFGPSSSSVQSRNTGSSRASGDLMLDSPGLMGRESDREVLDAVKFALTLFERGKN